MSRNPFNTITCNTIFVKQKKIVILSHYKLLSPPFILLSVIVPYMYQSQCYSLFGVTFPSPRLMGRQLNGENKPQSFQIATMYHSVDRCFLGHFRGTPRDKFPPVCHASSVYEFIGTANFKSRKLMSNCMIIQK